MQVDASRRQRGQDAESADALATWAGPCGSPAKEGSGSARAGLGACGVASQRRPGQKGYMRFSGRCAVQKLRRPPPWSPHETHQPT